MKKPNPGGKTPNVPSQPIVGLAGQIGLVKQGMIPKPPLGVAPKLAPMQPTEGSHFAALRSKKSMQGGG